MKKITILTLFPDVFENFKKFSIIKRAISSKKVKINIVDFRKFSKNKHKKVDDYQFGGGAGMIIALPAIVAAIKKYKTKNSLVILTSPQGKPFNQTKAKQLANSSKDIIIVCGHYEGFDARIVHYVDQIVSLGDFILTGGEIPAMAITEAITRLIKGVISQPSLDSESFNNNLLDYDAYTRPESFEGHNVPKVLLSGNHKLINDFRKANRLAKTKKYRPDLLKSK
ncbi:MAG: tRNA (guanosine(37)-N1)-methyltransferase TrmD [Mycoplasmoidaceae bacterium]|nr:tRNA (guanosine(37)-N1)-methyltransferase TrmD [Mycoplasmoidaceae bacterium]